jgi:hypothetical protein
MDFVLIPAFPIAAAALSARSFGMQQIKRRLWFCPMCRRT